MDRYDELEALISLRKKEVLSEEEFVEQKRRILDLPHARNAVGDGAQNWVQAHRTQLAILFGVCVLSAAFWYGSKTDVATVFASADERLCRTAIQASLINPETVEFYDFGPSGHSAYLSAYEADARKQLEDSTSGASGAGLSGFYADAFASSKRSIIDKGVREMVDAERALLQPSGSATYMFRIKATGRLGNEITSNQFCAIKSGSCDCVSGD